MVYIKQRYNKWEARVRVPKEIRARDGGAELRYRTLAASSRRAAKVEAEAWVAGLRAEWLQEIEGAPQALSVLRETYVRNFAPAVAGVFGEMDDPLGESYDTHTAAIEFELSRMSDLCGERELTEEEQGKVWALKDAISRRMGRKVKPRRALEQSFRELADEHLRLWRAAPGRKVTNTEQQKQATFDLFARYWGDRPIRDVGRADASAFIDTLRQLDPNWARTGSKAKRAQLLSWTALVKEYGGRDAGLADATVNRHVATLSALWKWAEEREHCEGRNPFDGHRRKLTPGRNKHGYVAWEADELARLLSPPPKRNDLTEVILVAMFTGMRLDEIASLTFDRVRQENGVPYIEVVDAKTPAGNRKVPLHARLAWLAKRAKSAQPDARVWPRFLPEGRGKKPGGDAGKLFTAHKQRLGFTDRRKAFHSLRKNVVGQLERARVPQNEVAQLVGHEKQGMTFGTYGVTMTLEWLAEIVALIDYPDVPLPQPPA